MKKFLSYVLTFLVMFFISAATTVSLAYFGNSSTLTLPNYMAGDEGGYGALFSGILAAFDKNKQFNINGDLDVEVNGEEISVVVYVNIDINDQSDIKVGGFAGVRNNGKIEYIRFSYVGQTIFLSTDNTAVKLATADISDLGKTIERLLPSKDKGESNAEEKVEENADTETDETAGESFLDALMPKLMESLNNMVQTDLDNGDKQIEIDIEGLASGRIVVDEDNQPKKAFIETEELEGIKLTANLQVDFDDSIIITNPELSQHKSYLDITRLASVIEQTIALRDIEARAQITLDGNEHFGNLVANLENKDFSLNFDDRGSVAYLNKDIYLSLDDINLLITNNLLQTAKGSLDELLKDKVSKDDILSSEVVQNALNTIKKYNPVELIELLRTFSIEDDKISLTLNAGLIGMEGKIDLEVSVDRDYVDGLKVSGNIEGHDVIASLRLSKTDKRVAVNDTKYLNLEELINLNKEYFTTDGLSLRVNLNVRGEKDFDLVSALSFDRNGYYEFTGSTKKFGGIDFGFVGSNGDIYARLNNIYLKASEERLKGIISSLKLEDRGFDTSVLTEGFDVKEFVKSLEIPHFEIKDILNSIKSLRTDSGRLVVSLDGSLFGLGDIDVDATFENSCIKVLSFNLEKVKGYDIDGKIEVVSNHVEPALIDTAAYLDVEKIISLNKDYFASGALDLGITLGVSGNNNLSLSSTLRYNDKGYIELGGLLGLDREYSLNLISINKFAYVKLDNIAVMGDINDIIEMLKEFGVEIPEFDGSKKDDILSSLKDKFNFEDFDISKLSIIKSVSIDSSAITLSLDLAEYGYGVCDVEIVLNEGIVKYVSLSLTNVNGNNISAEIEVVSNSVTEKAVDQNEYLDVVPVIKNIYALKDLTNANIAAALEGELYGKQVAAELNLGGDLTKEQYYVALALSGAYNLGLDIRYINDEVYLHVAHSFIKVSKDKLVELLKDLGFEDQFGGGQEVTEKLKQKLGEIKVDFKALIKEVSASSDGLRITLSGRELGQEQDLTIAISLLANELNEIEFINLVLGEIGQVSLKARLKTNDFVMPYIAESQYLDLDNLVEIVYNLANSQDLSASLEATIKNANGSTYLTAGADLQKTMLANGLNGYGKLGMTMNGESISLDTYYIDNILYASFNGLKVKVASSKIENVYQEVMQMLGKDDKAYADYVYAFVLLLQGEKVENILSNFKLDSSGLTGGLGEIKLTADDFFTILNSIQISANRIALFVNGALFGQEGRINIDLRLANGLPTKLSVYDLVVKDKRVDFTATFDYSKPELNTLTSEQMDKYIDLDGVSKVLDSTLNTLKKGSISGNVVVDFMFAGEHNQVILDYGIRLVKRVEKPKSIKDYKLEMYINGNFMGAYVDIKYADRVFYLNIMDLKVYAEFDSLNDIIKFINDEFNAKINFDATEIDKLIDKLDSKTDVEGKSFEEIFHDLATLNLDYIDHVDFNEGQIEVHLNSGEILSVNYGELINQVVLVAGTTRVELNSTKDWIDMGLTPQEKSLYQPWTILTDAYYATRNTLDAMQFNVTATAESHQNGAVQESAVVNFALNLIKRVDAEGKNYKLIEKFKGDVTVNQKDAKHVVNFGYMDSDQHLYFDYDSLKISMEQHAFRELLAVVLTLLNFDPNTIAFLQDASSNLDLKLDNLQGLAPEVDFGNPLKLISLLKGLSLEDGVFKITIDAAKINSKFKDDITISLATSKDKIDSIGLSNIYVGKGTKSFDLLLNFNGLGLSKLHTAEGTTELEENKVVGQINEIDDIQNTDTYIDITDSPNLVKAIINTTSFKDFHIIGDVQLSLGSINAATVHVDVKVKLDDEGKPTIAAQISGYPLVGGVTDKNTNGAGALFSETLERNRSIYIYYRDGFIYLRTYDEKWGAYGALDRRTKISLQTFLDNLEGGDGYVNWLFGFSDNLQNTIDQAIEKTRNSTEKTNVSKVLEAYSYDGTFHNIQINLGEIIHNSDIGSLSVGLSTYKTKLGDDTEDHDYLYSMTVNLELVNILDLKTTSGNPLHLDGSGQPVDLDTSFMDGYAWPADGEYSSTGGRDFEQTNKNYVNITLDNNGGTGETTLRGMVGSPLKLPTPVREERVGNDLITYEFVGWYLADGTKFIGDGFPRQDITLVAHWKQDIIRHYYTVTIHYNDGREDYTFEVLENDTIMLSNPTRDPEDHYDDKYCTFFTFKGFYLDGEIFRGGIMPSNDIVLEAQWQSYSKNYYDITYETEHGEAPETQRKLEGSLIYEITLENVETMRDDLPITYKFLGWFDEEGNPVNDFTLTRDIHLTARWQEIVPELYTFKIVDNGKVIYENQVYEGTAIAAPANLTVDGAGYVLVRPNTLWFEDQEFKTPYVFAPTMIADGKNAGQYKMGVMPSQDFTIYVRNLYTLSYIDKYGTAYQGQQYYQGETIKPITNYTKQQTDDGTAVIDYTYTGLAGLPSGNIMPNQNLTLTVNWQENVRYWTNVKFHVQIGSHGLHTGDIKVYYKTQKVGGQEFTIKILQGEVVVQGTDGIELDWQYKSLFSKYVTVKMAGFRTSISGSITSTITVTPDRNKEMQIYIAVD